MRVDSLVLNNVELLYDAILTISEQNGSSVHDIRFDNQYVELLELMNINFNIVDANMFDFIYLKRNYPVAIKNSEVEYCTDTAYAEFGEVSSETLADYGHFILDDVQPSYPKDIKAFMIPLGLQRCSIGIVLTGPSLANLIGPDPVKFFIDATGGKCVKVIENDRKVFLQPEEYNFLGDEDFKIYVVSKFVKDYYRHMLDSLLRTDLSSAYGLYTYMTSVVEDDKAFQLCTLSSPFGVVEFNIMENDTIKDILSDINEKSINMGDPNYNAKNTVFTFVMNTDISVYAKIVELLPRKCIIATEPLINIVGRDYEVENLEYPAVLDEKFELRINNKISSVVESINNIYGNRDDILKKAALLFPSEKIMYVIKLSCEDANMYLYDILSSVYDNLSYTDDLTKKILTDMSGIMGKLLATLDDTH